MQFSNLDGLSVHFKRARIAARLTQREAATAAGVSPLLVSQFERGALTELGTVKLLSLLRAVGLELQIRPGGHERTLNDIEVELDNPPTPDRPDRIPQRVRHPRKQV